MDVIYRQLINKFENKWYYIERRNGLMYKSNESLGGEYGC